MADVSDTVLARESTSPHRARDPSPRIGQKHLFDDEGMGPLSGSPEIGSLSLLQSVNKQK